MVENAFDGRVIQRVVRLPDGAEAHWPVVTRPLPADEFAGAFAGAAGYDVVLLVDGYPSMAVWRETITDFASLLAGLPSVGAVRTRPLGTAGDPATTPRLLLLFTDGADPGWCRGVHDEAVRQWAEAGPVAVVHLLPHQMWRRTCLTAGPRRIVRTVEGALQAGDADGCVPVPLLELDPGWFGAWLGLALRPGPGAADLPCLLFPRDQPRDQPRDRPRDRRPGAPASVATFKAVASPEAYELATCLAAAPLNLDVMRLVQAELLPGSRPEHLAEILVSGLVRPIPPDPDADADGLVTHDFDPDVRAGLLALARRSTIRSVVRVLGARLGGLPAVRRTAESVADPTMSIDELPPGERRFAEVQAAVLRALSGAHLRLAGHIQGLVATAAAHEAMEAEMSLGQEPETVATSAPRPSVKVPAIWGSVPPRNPNFTGRSELLAQVHERLTGGTTAVLPEALHGMGGVGKTQVVVEFVYLNASEYDVVWWIPAERPAQVVASMAELAQKLRLPVKAEAAAVPAVKEALRVGVPYARWLLIFDNADTPDDVRQYFPLGGPGHILVTSRNPQWSSVAKAVEVDVFRRAESQALLTRRAPTLAPAESDALAEVLGDLPLAIEQAAAWLAETGMQAGEYLALFREKRIELMEMSPPADYQLPVAAAWNVSLDHLARTRPASLRLLQLCAFLAPEPIARTLLSNGHRMQVTPELGSALRDPIQLGRAIREINRYALARIDHAKNTIQMHRLVQAVLIERMTPEERVAMRHAAHQLLATNNPQEPADRGRWQLYGELYPHLVASGAITDAEDDWVRDLVIGEAKYHSYWGNPQESLSISQSAYNAWKRTLGREAPQTMEIGRWLGYVLFSLGRYREAAALNASLLERHERGPDDNAESLLEAMQAVASDRRVEGRFQEALDLSREVYDRCVQLFGDDDPLTLNAAHNLAVSLRLVARFDEARDIDEATWQRKVQVYGQNHEESLRAQRGVLIDRRQLGDYIASHEEFERLAESFVESLGERDPQTVETNRSLSVTRRKAGEHPGALSISEDALQRYEAAFGPDNPGTMSAALNLSLDLRQAGRLDRAREVATENIQRFRATLGEAHPHSQAAEANLAIILRAQGSPQEARALNETTLVRLRDSIGPEHVLTLSCTTNLASDLFALGDIAAAYDLDQGQIELYRASMGADHPSTLAAALNLAIDLRELGREAEAEALHRETVERYVRVLGVNHLATKDAVKWRRANCDMDVMPL
ncbi:FxSxx-COOH system tetratricopeptide repeat protein [Catenuloplanes japonicus]|uniref:FxSxx-COOH system tetratricopeptide repeat protein n=1 Tax=Catenuloplanes japonicus TaxID=33876 RepID=UPI00068F0693|nr:FxSxx-COOH system tetratricopeptide repeat protein [Catenuloplanes japonicus]